MHHNTLQTSQANVSTKDKAPENGVKRLHDLMNLYSLFALPDNYQHTGLKSFLDDFSRHVFCLSRTHFALSENSFNAFSSQVTTVFQVVKKELKEKKEIYCSVQNQHKLAEAHQTLVHAYSALNQWIEQVLSLKYCARANGYSVCLVDASELLSPTFFLQENQLCIALTLDEVLYCVIDPLSRKQRGRISWEALGDPFEGITSDLVQLMPCLPDILTITGRVGHTRAYSPQVIKSFLGHLELAIASIQILALVHSDVASINPLMPSYSRTEQLNELSTYVQRINELIDIYRVAQDARITLKGTTSFWKTEWNEQYDFHDDDSPSIEELKSISSYWTFLVDGKVQWRVIDAQLREHFYKPNQVTYGDKGKGKESAFSRLRTHSVNGHDANAYPYETKNLLISLWINPSLEKMIESVLMVASYITHTQKYIAYTLPYQSLLFLIEEGDVFDDSESREALKNTVLFMTQDDKNELLLHALKQFKKEWVLFYLDQGISTQVWEKIERFNLLDRVVDMNLHQYFIDKGCVPTVSQDRIQTWSKLGLFKDQHRCTQYSAALRRLNHIDVEPIPQRVDTHQRLKWATYMVFLVLLIGWILAEQSNKLKKSNEMNANEGTRSGLFS